MEAGTEPAATERSPVYHMDRSEDIKLVTHALITSSSSSLASSSYSCPKERADYDSSPRPGEGGLELPVRVEGVVGGHLEPVPRQALGHVGRPGEVGEGDLGGHGGQHRNVHLDGES